MKKKVPWNNDDDATLTKLWNDGKLTTSQIGGILGRNKNGIIGRAHRLGLCAKHTGGVGPRPTTNRPRKVKAGARKPPKPPKPPKSPKRPGKPFVFGPSKEVDRKPPQYVAPTQKWTGEGVPMLEATHGQCRAVLGSSDDSRGLAIYCGKPIKEGTTFSFCSDHYSKFISGYWSR